MRGYKNFESDPHPRPPESRIGQYENAINEMVNNCRRCCLPGLAAKIDAGNQQSGRGRHEWKR